MNAIKTSSMLQRIPVILAVTAASYGLQVPPQALRWNGSKAEAVRLLRGPQDKPLLPYQAAHRDQGRG